MMSTVCLLLLNQLILSELKFCASGAVTVHPFLIPDSKDL